MSRKLKPGEDSLNEWIESCPMDLTATQIEQLWDWFDDTMLTEGHYNDPE